MRILIVDDEPVTASSLKRLLRRRGYRDVETCLKGSDAINKIKEKDFDLVLLDYLMPEIDGLKVMAETKPYKPYTEFLMLTAVDDLQTAVKAIRLGAFDYLLKPVDTERLLLSIDHAYERRGLRIGLVNTESNADEPKSSNAFPDVITRCPRMKALLSFAQVMAKSGNPILLTGESGTGKELLARGIYRAGLRPEGPFVAVNVSSIPESLFESQFFGHVKGAFTGAERDFPGLFEQADGGTLFLDEIGELPLNLQVKLLRVLEEGRVVRLGETKPIHVDVIIISATNKDLDKSCQKGAFRLDLLYRLKSIHIHLPPLRERIGDVPLLASHFLEKAIRQRGRQIAGFSPEALDWLSSQEFPGNIRELAQMVDNAALVADSPLISPHHLGLKTPPSPSLARTLCTLKENDKAHVAYVLSMTGGDRNETARILGVTVRQVQRRVAEMKRDERWQNIIDGL